MNDQCFTKLYEFPLQMMICLWHGDLSAIRLRQSNTIVDTSGKILQQLQNEANVESRLCE